MLGCVSNVGQAEISRISLILMRTHLGDIVGFDIVLLLMKRGFFFLFLLQWNQYMDKDLRDSYYFNWPVYFP